MASLPPRPESPLRMPPRDDRRHLPDERDRDRRSAAQPMAPRYRGERVPERDRPFIPRPKLDSYIPPGFEGRRDPRGFDDRATDRDRFRRDGDRDTRERDRRNWERQQRDRERERERERSPGRRRISPDRRPFDRDRALPRRPLSPPRRFGRRSRSPPPRRRFSRSPPPHYNPRNRTRSRSRGPFHSPPRRVRLGNHGLERSPRSRSSRSPQRRRLSKERSPLSPSHREKSLPISALESGEHIESKASHQIPTQTQDVHMDVTPAGQPANSEPSKLETTSTTPPPTLPTKSITDESEPTITSAPEQSGLPAPSTPAAEERTTSEAVKIESHPEPSEVKTELEGIPVPSTLPSKPVASISSSVEPVDVKMDVDPAKPSATVSNSVGSTSPMPSPIINDYARGPPNGPPTGPPTGLPTGPRWGPNPRSPPRGPRNHGRHLPPTHSASHQSTPRGPRREFRGGGPPPSHANPNLKPGIPLPPIPRYTKQHPNPITEIETELSKLQHHRAHLATEHLQLVKGSRRALQELDMATIDLQAAENRRRIADMQLEKAKSGSLGIDASPIDFES